MHKLPYLLTIGGTAVSFLFGEWHISLSVLLLFIAIDITTGIIKGLITGQFTSKVSFKGMLRKATIMLVIIIAHQLDVLTESEFMFRTMTVFFYIGIEGLSITENLAKAGVPLPDGITKHLKQLSKEEREHIKEKKQLIDDETIEGKRKE